jgi:hypothetical protein
MKVHEVIMRAMSGELPGSKPRESSASAVGRGHGGSDAGRTMAMKVCWTDAVDQPSPKRIAVPVFQQVLRVYREQYSDFDVRHFHEKLMERHNHKLSYTPVKTALQMAGLVKRSPRLLATNHAAAWKLRAKSSLTSHSPQPLLLIDRLVKQPDILIC